MSTAVFRALEAMKVMDGGRRAAAYANAACQQLLANADRIDDTVPAGKRSFDASTGMHRGGGDCGQRRLDRARRGLTDANAVSDRRPRGCDPVVPSS